MENKKLLHDKARLEATLSAAESKAAQDDRDCHNLKPHPAHSATYPHAAHEGQAGNPTDVIPQQGGLFEGWAKMVSKAGLRPSLPVDAAPEGEHLDIDIPDLQI
mmetsp:Transcript_35031/g.70777  ORF Transcript_35031/g.70777 Transcript_35031/m.70777 type:complete len:104 (-) Transcript_35031:169-480(-)